MYSVFSVEHQQLFDAIQERLALSLDDHRRADVVRVVDEMIATKRAQDVRHFTNMLTGQPTKHSLWQNIISVVTVGETYFFRDQNQLNALRYSILPNLIEQRRKLGQKYLRLWSAGCSSGEEPYTLGIILRELISDIHEWDILILATDLNAGSLERARGGYYRAWSFRSETPEGIRHRWFTPEKDGYKIDPAIRNMVTFEQLNLANSNYASSVSRTIDMDVILCRNVMIYFDRPTQAAVISRFHWALHHQGWLILGPSELVPPDNQEFKPVNFENAVVYQKQAVVRQDALIETEPIIVPIVTIPKPPLRKTVTSTLPPLSLVAKKPAPMPPAAMPKANEWERAMHAANREQWDEALKLLEDAEKAQPLQAEVHYLRGVVELNLQEQDKALASLRRAIYCDANFVMAHYTLGELYQKQGNSRKASYQWNQARRALATFDPQARIAFSDDLTAAMLGELLQYRLANLSMKE